MHLDDRCDAGDFGTNVNKDEAFMHVFYTRECK